MEGLEVEPTGRNEVRDTLQRPPRLLPATPATVCPHAAETTNLADQRGPGRGPRGDSRGRLVHPGLGLVDERRAYRQGAEGHGPLDRGSNGRVTSPGDVGVSFSGYGHRRPGSRGGRRQGQAEPGPGHDRRPFRPGRRWPRRAAPSPTPRASSRRQRAPRRPRRPLRRPASAQAQSQVDSAQRTLSYTKSSNALSATGYNRSVSQAQTAYDQAVSAQTTSCSGGSSPACSAAKNKTTAAHQQPSRRP